MKRKRKAFLVGEDGGERGPQGMMKERVSSWLDPRLWLNSSGSSRHLLFRTLLRVHRRCLHTQTKLYKIIFLSLSLFFLFYLDSHAGRRQPSSWKCIVPSWQLPANSVFFFQKSKLLPWLSPVTAVIIITREKKVSALSFLFFCCHFYLYPIRRCALPRRNQFWFAAATQRSGWLGTAGKKTISFKLV